MSWTKKRATSAALLCAAVAVAAPPAVTKVEPPNWWAGHSINPVRLLIRGTGLHSARVTSTAKLANVRINESGTYLFVDLYVPSRPANLRIGISTRDGATEVPFDIIAPRPRTGRFQGLSTDDVMYLVMPDRFADGDPSNNDPPVSRGMFDRSHPRYYHGGDFRGIIQRLPYLKALGVTALWLNPIYDNANRVSKGLGSTFTDYHGYGAIDFYAVDEHFGALSEFRDLVEAAHKQGIKIVQDQVANHTGPHHPWVTDPPLPNWFHGTRENHLREDSQMWTLTDPRSPPALRKPILDGWFVNILPDLNQEEPEVARYLIQNTLWWIGATGLDAIRQDTLPYVPRTFWRDWMAAIKREYPGFTVIGETFNRDPALVAFFQGGRKQFDGVDSGIDTLFDFPLYFAVRDVFAGGRPARGLPAVLASDRLYPDASRLITFLGLHDVERFMNLKDASVPRLKAAFTFLLTTRGIPMIYYGDEIAMAGGDDPDNRRDFPVERFANPGEVYQHIARISKLRADHDCLRRGELKHLAASDRVYAYERTSQACRAVVVLNTGSEPVEIEGVRVPAGASEVRVGQR